MTSLTDTQVITASGGLVELGFQSTDRTNLAVSGTSTSNAVELVTTTVVCDGSPILVEFQCGMSVTNGEYLLFGLWVDGVYTAAFEGSMAVAGRSPISAWSRITPSAGSRVISIRWWKWSGGTSTSYIEGNCRVRVSKIVQATQWPAVTTGTIICTSSTRPSAPFEGQTIYETDTDLSWTWNGSAWVSPLLAFKPPSVRCLATGTSQTLPTGALTAINFPAEEYDTNSMHSTSSNTSRVTVPYTGLYLVNSYVATGAAGGNRYIYILKNGGQWMFKAAVVDPTNSASAGIVDSICAVVPCAANDYIESGVFHNTGSSIAVGAGSWLSVSWYGQYL